MLAAWFWLMVTATDRISRLPYGLMIANVAMRMIELFQPLVVIVVFAKVKKNPSQGGVKVGGGAGDDEETYQIASLL